MQELNQEEIALTSGIGRCFCKYTLYQVLEESDEYHIDIHNHELSFIHPIAESDCHRKCCIEHKMLAYKYYEDIDLASVFDPSLINFLTNFYQSC